MKIQRVFLAALLALTFPFISHAQIPRTLSYQGVLTDNAGKPRPDGNYTFKFCLYGSNSGGSPIWCESKSLPVKNGLFSTVLGEQTPFGAAVKFDKQYWLGIQVGNEPELSPRMALTSVGYSFSSLRADTARVSVASLADTTWGHIGLNIYRLNGNVGIGTMNPQAPLHIGSEGGILIGSSLAFNEITFIGSDPVNIVHPGSVPIIFSTDNAERLRINPNGGISIANGSGFNEITFFGHDPANIAHPDNGPIIFSTNNTERLRINPNGGLSIASGSGYNEITFPGADPVNIVQPGIAPIIFSTDGAERLRINPNGGISLASGSGYNEITFFGSDPANIAHPDNGPIIFSTNNVERFRISPDGNIGIGTATPSAILDVAGRTKTQVLEITGGSDLAEPFEISESQPIPKGALVIIDEENPGQLKLSHQAYDKRVAGVVSGAGGINPGLTLTQQGVMEGGQNVALSGRVYALATAANGPIKPGDLLTTSDVPGHAMKATNFVRWQGAVIGKAMSSLEKGDGLVLVLVNLQ